MVLGFIALSLWYVLRPREVEMHYPAYSSYSPLRDGSGALYELLEGVGASPQRHLATEYDYAEGACVLAVLGHEDDLQSVFAPKLDFRELRDWLERGGSLVMLASVDSIIAMSLESELLEDSPLAHQPTTVPQGRDLALTGTSSAGASAAMSRVYQVGYQYELSPMREGLFASVRNIEIAQPVYMTGTDAVSLLTYGPDNPVLLYKQFGKGELFWLTCPEIVTNSWIERADNHRLLLAVIGRAMQDRPLYFDEYIHGYTGSGSNVVQLLFKTRGGHLLLALCAAVIVIYLGLAISPARSEPMPVPPRRQASEMVLAQADLYRRAGLRSGIAAHLVEGLRRALMDARHEHNPPSNIELLRWLRDTGLDQSLADASLISYLTSGRQPENERAFMRFARSCDLIAVRLRKLGASALGGSA
jgi:hypothetical protein